MNEIFEEVCHKLAEQKDTWLLEELFVGLREVKVKVSVVNIPEECGGDMRTTLTIETEDGRFYQAGLRQKIKLVIE